MILPIALAGVSAGVALAFYMVLLQIDERAVVRASLRQLDGYEMDSVRDQELLNPLTERAVMPVLRGLTGIGRHFTPVGYVDKVRQKLVYAGMPASETVDRFLAIRVVTVALIPVAFVLVYGMSGLSGTMLHGAFGLSGLALFLGPDAVLNRKVAERQYAMRVRLPDLLDLLVISVEAGLGFEQALDRTIVAVPGPIQEEFGRMLGEVRAGASRGDALRGLEKRSNVPELRSFVLAILQADTFGVSIGRVLRSQADEMRIKRRQLAQERAQKAPVKMLVPMVFCIFPALFVVVLGPAVINITKAFA